MKCTVKLIWSEEDNIWYSKSMDERFGLTLESNSFDALIEKVKTAAPEMLELVECTGEIDLTFEIERVEKIKVAARNGGLYKAS